MIVVEARGLRTRLGARLALDGVDVAIRPGEVVGLIGANGAGKSTLLRCLAGLRRADAGSVRLDGEPLERLPPVRRARVLAYLPQHAPVHWPLAVHDVVALGRLPHRAPWSGLGDADRRAVDDALEACDVATLAARPISTLSGGERARVLIARALAGEPRVLLADEPVAGLDPAHQIAVMRLLAERARRGTATLVVLHDLNLAARHCTRLVLLHEGRVAAAGRWDEVLDDAHLRPTLGVRLFVGTEAGGPVVVPIGVARDQDR